MRSEQMRPYSMIYIYIVGVGVAGVYAGPAVEKDKVIDHEQVCPQHLPIVDLMKEASAILDA